MSMQVFPQYLGQELTARLLASAERGKERFLARELDRYNTILAIAAQQDQDERHEDAAVAAHEVRYEAWLSLEGNEP